MSVLETFYFLFKADTDPIQKGAVEAEKKVDKMAQAIDDAGNSADVVGSKFSGLIAAAGAFVAGFASVGALMENMAHAEAIGRAATSLGDAVEDVDAFTRSALRFGGDVQGTLDSLTDIAEKVGEALQDTESGAAKAFTALKIGLKDSEGQAKGGVEAMLDLASAVEGLSRSEAIFRIKELGVTDNRTVDMVLAGRDALEQMMASQKAFGVITKQDTEAINKFKAELGSSTALTGFAATKFTTWLLPALTSMLEWFQDAVKWMSENKTVTIGFFGAIAAVIAAIYLPAMLSAAAATLVALAPILAIGAAITAVAGVFALAVDDIIAFREGNASLVGEIAKNYPIVGDIANALAETFLALKDVGVMVFDLLADALLRPSAAIHNLKYTWDKMVDGFMERFPTLAKIINAVKDLFTWDDEEGPAIDVNAPEKPGEEWGRPQIPPALAAAAQEPEWGKPQVPPGQLPPQTVQALTLAQQQITVAERSPLASQTSNSIMGARTENRETNVTVQQVTVETQATDAQGISQSIGSTLSDQMRAAVNTWDDGVLA